MGSYGTYPFVTGLFHLARYPQGPSCNSPHQDSLPFQVGVIFHYKHRAHLLPIHHQWTLGTLDSDEGRYEHECAHVFSRPCFQFSCGCIMAVLCLIFGKLASSFPPQPPHLTSPPTALKAPFHFATSSPTCAVLCFSVFLCHRRPNGCEGESHCGLELHFPKG